MAPINNILDFACLEGGEDFVLLDSGAMEISCTGCIEKNMRIASSLSPLKVLMRSFLASYSESCISGLGGIDGSRVIDP